MSNENKRKVTGAKGILENILIAALIILPFLGISSLFGHPESTLDYILAALGCFSLIVLCFVFTK